MLNISISQFKEAHQNNKNPENSNQNSDFDSVQNNSFPSEMMKNRFLGDWKRMASA